MNSPAQSNRNAILIVNRLSRYGFLGARSAAAALERNGIHVKRSFVVRSARHIPRIIRAAVAQGEKLIVVGGGDGTIAASADPLAYTNATLGILPLGTGNDFARVLGIPRDLDGACRVIGTGKVAQVNLGRVNGSHFVNATSIGFAARISHRATGWMKRAIGVGAYVLGAFIEFWAYRPFRAKLTADGEEQEIRTSLIVVWNGRFHAGWQLAATQGPSVERRLVVYAPAAPSRLNLLQMAISLRMGQLVQSPPLLAFEADKVAVEAEPPQEVDVDGEVLHRTPVLIELARDALKVMVPEAYADR